MLKDVFQQLDLHFTRIDSALEVIRNNPDWRRHIDDDTALVLTIDAFIFRYIKIQDAMGKRLFPHFLDALGDYDDTMSLLDILDRLEKLGILNDADKWMEYRKLRNILTHEYPDNRMEILDGIDLAVASIIQIRNIYESIKNNCINRNLV